MENNKNTVIRLWDANKTQTGDTTSTAIANIWKCINTVFSPSFSNQINIFTLIKELQNLLKNFNINSYNWDKLLLIGLYFINIWNSIDPAKSHINFEDFSTNESLGNIFSHDFEAKLTELKIETQVLLEEFISKENVYGKDLKVFWEKLQLIWKKMNLYKSFSFWGKVV